MGIEISNRDLEASPPDSVGVEDGFFAPRLSNARSIEEIFVNHYSLARALRGDLNRSLNSIKSWGKASGVINKQMNRLGLVPFRLKASPPDEYPKKGYLKRMLHGLGDVDREEAYRMDKLKKDFLPYADTERLKRFSLGESLTDLLELGWKKWHEFFKYIPYSGVQKGMIREVLRLHNILMHDMSLVDQCQLKNALNEYQNKYVLPDLNEQKTIEAVLDLDLSAASRVENREGKTFAVWKGGHVNKIDVLTSRFYVSPPAGKAQKIFLQIAKALDEHAKHSDLSKYCVSLAFHPLVQGLSGHDQIILYASAESSEMLEGGNFLIAKSLDDAKKDLPTKDEYFQEIPEEFRRLAVNLYDYELLLYRLSSMSIPVDDKLHVGYVEQAYRSSWYDVESAQRMSRYGLNRLSGFRHALQSAKNDLIPVFDEEVFRGIVEEQAARESNPDNFMPPLLRLASNF